MGSCVSTNQAGAFSLLSRWSPTESPVLSLGTSAFLLLRPSSAMLAFYRGIRSIDGGDHRRLAVSKAVVSRQVRRQYADERIDFAIYKKSKSLFDIFSKKEPVLDPDFVKMLRCPISRNPLRYDEKENELIEDQHGIVYAVVEGVPILTPSAAKSLHRYVESESTEEK